MKIEKKWVQKTYEYKKDVEPNKNLKNAQEAAKRIIWHIKNNLKIVIFGDYDVDGVSSSSIMYKALLPLTKNIEIYLPNRQEGYGISLDFINKTNADLIVTVDNGITAIEQVKRAKELGIEIIVTDHHNPQDVLPDCLIVNPKLDNNDFLKDICGAGVAWHVCIELYTLLGLDKNQIFKMMDILTLATIADMVPMRNANKMIVKQGLHHMKNNIFSSDSLRQIINTKIKLQYGLEPDDIGFSVAPIFNAIGRLEDPNVAFNILAQNRYDFIPRALALNEERKTLQNEKYIKAMEQVDLTKNFIIYVDDTIEKGMVGLVAGDLMNKFKKPTIVISKKGGSGRSLYDISIFDIVKKAEHLLVRWGGHEAACGLTIEPENIEKFKNEIYKITEHLEIIPIEYYQQEIKIENLKDILQYMESLRPFGQENPEPKWLIKNLKIYDQRIIGKNENVLMLNLQGVKSFMFKTQELINKNQIDVICTIKRDGGLQVEDWK